MSQSPGRISTGVAASSQAALPGVVTNTGADHHQEAQRGSDISAPTATISSPGGGGISCRSAPACDGAVK